MKKIIISSLIVVLISALMLISCKDSGSMEIISDSESVVSADDIHDIENEEVVTTIITVDVCGAVVCPGVYDLNEGDRVIDAINAAGGMLDEANADIINKADLVKDGQQIRVPFIGEESAEADDGRININTADIAELTTLPGIGETRAQAIIDYRETNGNYKQIEDIMNVAGIKEGTFNKFCDRIKVN
ncbi:MAG: ComEA family DNA-binding protein [Lachnospiraceae bacterium]|nr:ComEA family DNA-binding protein [Lachnospiraceae bacterium]